MRTLAWAAFVAALVVACGPATAGCRQTHTIARKVARIKANTDCRVDLNLAPAASRQIVAGEQFARPPAPPPPVQPIPAYTGPMIGAAPNMGMAPEIGFRWQTD